MALSKAALKDLLRQVPEYSEEELPTLEDKKEFVAAQLQQHQKLAYRAFVDIEVAKEFANSKDTTKQDTAKQSLEESISSLKAYKPTIKVLTQIAKELAE